MSEQPTPPTTAPTPWGIDLDVAVCTLCHWRYLVHSGQPGAQCPNCHRAALSVLSENPPEMDQPYPPELLIPFAVAEPDLERAVHAFVTGIPFPPEGLTETSLRTRLTQLYLPMWLVDGQARAYWQAEAGFNYEVVSHQESYNGDLRRWQSREIKEPRVRWENRVGRLNRLYQNVPAPALDDAAHMEQKIGRFHMESARSYDPDCLREAVVRLPDHPPKEAWSEAAAAFQKTAADECQKACAADHLRQFRWKAQVTRLNWTLMLLPVYAASYLDDQGQPQSIFIHGQTGQIAGSRRSSLRRARSISLSILLVGLLIFLSGLVLDVVGMRVAYAGIFSMYLIVFGVAALLASAVPLLIAWDFNRRQTLEQAQVK